MLQKTTRTEYMQTYNHLPQTLQHKRERRQDPENRNKDLQYKEEYRSRPLTRMNTHIYRQKKKAEEKRKNEIEQNRSVIIGRSKHR